MMTERRVYHMYRKNIICDFASHITVLKTQRLYSAGEIIMVIDLRESKACKLVRPFLSKSEKERKASAKQETSIQ